MAALKNKLAKGLQAYRKHYSAYNERWKYPDSQAMCDSNQHVTLIHWS